MLNLKPVYIDYERQPQKHLLKSIKDLHHPRQIPLHPHPHRLLQLLLLPFFSLLFWRVHSHPHPRLPRHHPHPRKALHLLLLRHLRQLPFYPSFWVFLPRLRLLLPRLPILLPPNLLPPLHLPPRLPRLLLLLFWPLFSPFSFVSFSGNILNFKKL